MEFKDFTPKGLEPLAEGMTAILAADRDGGIPGYVTYRSALRSACGRVLLAMGFEGYTFKPPAGGWPDPASAFKAGLKEGPEADRLAEAAWPIMGNAMAAYEDYGVQAAGEYNGVANRMAAAMLALGVEIGYPGQSKDRPHMDWIGYGLEPIPVDPDDRTTYPLGVAGGNDKASEFRGRLADMGYSEARIDLIGRLAEFERNDATAGTQGLPWRMDGQWGPDEEAAALKAAKLLDGMDRAGLKLDIPEGGPHDIAYEIGMDGSPWVPERLLDDDEIGIREEIASKLAPIAVAEGLAGGLADSRYGRGYIDAAATYFTCAGIQLTGPEKTRPVERLAAKLAAKFGDDGPPPPPPPGAAVEMG